MDIPKLNDEATMGHTTLSDILAQGQRSLVLFDQAGVKAVEALLTEKNGKPYIKCQVRGKEVQAKPEEVIRQLWIHRLLVHYRYSSARLQVEYPITFGRDTSKRADIIVMDSDRPTVPYVIIEVKQENAKDGKEQLKSYTLATGAPLALWSDGSQAIAWHRKNPNYFIPIPDLPTAQQTIEQIVNEPWTMDTLIEKEKEREAEGLKARSLRQLIEDMEDEVHRLAGQVGKRRVFGCSVYADSAGRGSDDRLESALSIPLHLLDNSGHP